MEDAENYRLLFGQKAVFFRPRRLQKLLRNSKTRKARAFIRPSRGARRIWPICSRPSHSHPLSSSFPCSSVAPRNRCRHLSAGSWRLVKRKLAMRLHFILSWPVFFQLLTTLFVGDPLVLADPLADDDRLQIAVIDQFGAPVDDGSVGHLHLFG